MSNENDFVLMPIRSAELVVGKPLPWSVYDDAGNFLLVKGYVLESQTQLEMLRANGFMRNYNLNPSKSTQHAAARKRPPSANKEPEAKDLMESITRMDKVKWHVGESLELQPIEIPEVRYNVRLVGFVSNQSVIVTAPTIDGKLAFVREGHAFVVRSFFGKRAYAFSSSVIKTVYTPYAYLHLGYPSQVRLATIRKGARAKVNVIASVNLGQPERTGAATLVDMSVGGASAVAKYKLGEVGEQGNLIVRLNVAEDEHYLTLEAALRSVTATESGDGYRHGIEFLNSTHHDKLVLMAYVNQILVDASA